MIIWLNGPFGVGKTTTANRLQALRPEWITVDTERIGYLLRPILDERAPVRDFQDWPAWRRIVVATVTSIHEQLGTTLVVPQTVLVERYWQEISEGIAAAGVELAFITLHASANEHERRIAEDQVETDAAEWRRARRLDYDRAYPWLSEASVVLDTSLCAPDDVVDLVTAKVFPAANAVS